ncbi:MAG: ATP-dependent DNA helicase RecG [Defluviicoccus sp.]|nr:ATP-dependent DNA helicase RecG [Defluviicoccus sp.]
MRPEILFPLFAEIRSLPGVGPRIGKAIERLAGKRLVDLLWHLPNGVIDRRFSPQIASAPDKAIVTIAVEIDRHLLPASRRVPYRVVCHDGTGALDLVFFNARPEYLETVLPVGEKRVVSGRVERYRDRLQMTHPDHIGRPGELDALKRVEPVYPLTGGLTARPLAKTVAEAVRRAPGLPEWNDPAWMAQKSWPGWREAVTLAHAPEDESALDPAHPARERLAYDELLANQLALALVRRRRRARPGRQIAGDGVLRGRARESFGFALTGAQEAAVAEIAADMAAPECMIRLLQGDVGSGKTVVACLAMLAAVETGAQAALMAPTEVLARQHFATVEPLARRIDVPVALLTGRERGGNRERVLAGLAGGATAIAIGTHALQQDAVAFADLALAVIDEQHRFGVDQRIALADKGRAVDMLVMTATPIPRTLTMTAYGDIDVSRLHEKPPGRRPVDTRVLPVDRLGAVIDRLRRAIAGGARVFWVCPVVEESETLDLAAATERHAALEVLFGDRVGLLHGRMKGPEKDAAMARFAGGEIDILVATTVIEVGVDVAEASVVVVEHAERFGLAQLHQLRGRVGRGERASFCLLLYGGPLTETARARLNVMRETDDGFLIAEEDLRLRGAGELLGTRQSGLPDFRLADLAAHAGLIEVARDDARLIVERDADLATPRGAALRTLLYLFERDAVVRTVRSG